MWIMLHGHNEDLLRKELNPVLKQHIVEANVEPSLYEQTENVTQLVLCESYVNITTKYIFL